MNTINPSENPKVEHLLNGFSMKANSGGPNQTPLVPEALPGAKATASGAEALLRRVAPTLLRWALGATFLSAVADRFGWWGAPGSANVSWGDWAHFVAYTATVNHFLPAGMAPALAVLATAAEALLGVALLLGAFPRSVAWASAGLLGLFAGAMTLSLGVKAPLDYSVFADAAAALLLGAWPHGSARTASRADRRLRVKS